MLSVGSDVDFVTQPEELENSETVQITIDTGLAISTESALEVASVNDDNTETSANIIINYDNYITQGTAYYSDLQNTESEYLQNNTIPPEKVKNVLLKEAEDANIILEDNMFDDNLLDRDTRIGDDILENPLGRSGRIRGTRLY